MRTVVADGIEQRVPLGLPGIELLLLGPPRDVGPLDALVFVHLHGGGVNVPGELRRALRPLHEGGELVIALGDEAAVDQRLGAVGEGVFDRVGVEVLRRVGAVRTASARTGAGLSTVSASTFGQNLKSDASAWSQVMSFPVCTAARPMMAARFE